MNEVEFRNWLTQKGKNKKVIGDCVSRLKRIEREFGHCDLDDAYHSDQCKFLLSAFEKMGLNDQMKQYPNANLPIGKYYMSTYRYSLKQYVLFMDDMEANL